jgi:AraC-like DNA-binding protein
MNIKTLRFSTDDFPEHERLESYREIYSRTIIKHDIEPIGDGPFHFEAQLCSLPGLGLASSFFSPCRRRHLAEHIDSDDLLFGVSLSGGCVLHQRGREAVIGGRGEAVLASAAHPVDVTIGTTTRHIALRLPRAILETRIADLDARNARRIPSDVEGLSLLIGYVGGINFAEPMEPELRDLIVAHVHDLVALVLGAKGDARYLAQQRGARVARREAILREIERRSGDRKLSVETIAILLGITPRYVHLLLEDTGKSFTHHVLERRLETASVLLHGPLGRNRKIADIAAEAGFTDLSYFNRSFRRRFGATPSDIRESIRSADRR